MKSKKVLFGVLVVCAVGVGIVAAAIMTARDNFTNTFKPRAYREAVKRGFTQSDAPQIAKQDQHEPQIAAPTVEFATEASQLDKVIANAVVAGETSVVETEDTIITREVFADKNNTKRKFVVETTTSKPADKAKAARGKVLKRHAYAADRLLVCLNAKADQKDLEKLNKKYGAKIIRKFGSRRFSVRIESADANSVRKLVKSYSDAIRSVSYAEPDYMVFCANIPNDSEFDKLWGLHNIGEPVNHYEGLEGADIGAIKAWDVTTGSRSVVVAVIDTGVDYTHPDLAPNMWTNPNEIAGNGIDDDGNGYIDDVHGWDFCNDDNDPMDDHYHGTHCAGTIGAAGNDGKGVVGVNWKVSMVPLKFLDEGGSGYISDGAQAIAYAADLGIPISSNSWGTLQYSNFIEDTINEAGEKNHLVIVAAGNLNTNNDSRTSTLVSYPAALPCPKMITVSASTNLDEKASFSSYGKTTADIFAPGFGIYSTSTGGEYRYLNGTSMATPHVAGACALIKSKYPNATNQQLKAIIMDSVDKNEEFEELCVSGGRLNVAKALNVFSGDATIPIITKVVADDSAGDNDGCMDRCEPVKFYLTVENIGTGSASGLTGTITMNFDDIEVTTNNVHFENIGGKGTTATNTEAFVIEAQENCLWTDCISFNLELKDSTGRQWVRSFAHYPDLPEQSEKPLEITIDGTKGEYFVKQYDLDEDTHDGVKVNDDKLEIEGNHWKKVDVGSITITKNTILRFSFNSRGNKPEIAAIGFDNDNTKSPEFSFQVYGTENWGVQDFHTYDSDVKTTWTYVIPVGKYCSGTYNSITFINDRDEPAEPYLDPESTFTNISLYEESEETDHELAVTINGSVNKAPVKGFDAQEDFVGGADVNSSGTELEITNNHFKCYNLGNITVTKSTVIEFDYYAKSEGELQGVGFGNGDSLNRSKIFQLFGTDKSGAIQNYHNASKRETKHYRIPVGQYYTGSFSKLVFANENDTTPTSWSTPHSKFSNIVITNVGEGTVTNHAPVAVNDCYSLDENATLSVSADTGVLANDVDEDSDALTAELVAQTEHGSLIFNSDGSFDYTPDPDFSGSDTFTYIAKDGKLDSNTATVTITVDAIEEEIADLSVNVNGVDVLSEVLAYSADQDVDSECSVEESKKIRITGNGWKKVYLPGLSITENTIIEFDFSSSAIGEIHGIGFDNDSNIDKTRTFEVYGTYTKWGIQDFNNYSGAGTTHYKIPVGKYFTGSLPYLVLVCDNDVSNPDSESVFSNIKIYEFENTAPVAEGESYLTVSGETLSVSVQEGVLANDSDAEGDAISATLVSTTANGTLELAEDGSFIYNANAGFTGNDSFTYKVSDGKVSSNTVTATITVRPSVDSMTVSLNGADVTAEISSFSTKQDTNSTISIEDSGKTLRLSGNGWKKLALPALTVTENTVIEFDFSSSAAGEIHGVSLEDDTKENPENAFMLYGSQVEWANQTFNSYNGSGTKHYKIPVGQYFTGSRPYLVFIMDNDVYAPASKSVFSNVKIYEEEPTTLSVTVDGLSKAYSASDYNSKQKGNATTIYAKGGSEIAIKGNGWKKIDLSSIEVTKDTIIEFDFASSKKGEIHGIFLDSDTTQNEEYLFNLYGTQDYGLTDYRNYEEESPATKHYKIPVGQFYTGSFKYLVFVMDEDVENATAESTFSNIKIYNLKSK